PKQGTLERERTPRLQTTHDGVARSLPVDRAEIGIGRCDYLLHSPSRLGVPRTWLLTGCISSAKTWVNIGAAKKATARRVSAPVLTRSWRTLVGTTKTVPGPTG